MQQRKVSAVLKVIWFMEHESSTYLPADSNSDTYLPPLFVLDFLLNAKLKVKRFI